MFAVILIALVILAVIAALYATHTTTIRAQTMMREAVQARVYAERVTAELSEQATATQQRCTARVRELHAEKAALEEEARVIYERVLAIRSRADAASRTLESIPKVRQGLPHATMLPVTHGGGAAFIDKLVLRDDGRLVFYAARPWTTTEPFVVGRAVTPDQCRDACAAKIAPLAPKEYSQMVWSRTDLEPCRGKECTRLFAGAAAAGFTELCDDVTKCQIGFIVSGGTVPESLRASLVAAYTRFRTLLYSKLLDGVDLAAADLEDLLLQNFHADDRSYLRSLHVLLEDQTPVSVTVGGTTHVISLASQQVPFHAAVLAIVMRYMRYRMQPPVMQLRLAA